MKMTSRALFTLLIVFLFAAFVGCSDDDDNITNPPDPDAEETIGAAGGTIEMDGDASLVIPGGALDADVDFTMMDAGSDYAAMLPSREVCSSVITIGPSGTAFGDPVQLTLHYSEEDLGGVDESSLLIYTDDGDGWTPLPTEVDEVNNVATAEINHLSDFVVTNPAGEAADGVYGIFEIVRLTSYVGEGQSNSIVDMIGARFDGVVNPCSPVQPMHPDSVYCNTFPLIWDEALRGYLDDQTTPEFLDLGVNYTFHVLASAEVPALEQTISMVEHEPVITNIMNMDPVSLDGFTVQWNDTSADSVTLALVLSNESLVQVRLPNNGSYTFSEAELAGMTPGTYYLGLSHYEKIFLTDVSGYDPNSYILAMTQDSKLVNLTDASGVVGAEGGTVLLGDDGRLVIPAGALTEPVIFEAEINSAPPTVPEGYTLLSPVYSIGPDGQQFLVDADLEMNYDESLLGDADEDNVAIFTHDGSDWSELDTYVDEDVDLAEAEISHLSDFVVAVPTPIVTEGVYAVLEVMRNFIQVGGLDLMRSDAVSCRFDAVVAEDPDTPLQASGATFGEWTMVWSSDSYEYVDMVDMDFLTLGEDYEFLVAQSTAVPAMDLDVGVVDDEVYVTNLAMGADVALDGFTLEWNGSSLGGTVELVMISPEAGGLSMDLPNTGSYTFSEAELADLNAGAGQILLNWEQEVPLVADGFDSNSFVRQIFTSLCSVNFSEEVALETVLYTETPNLSIPDATSGGGPGAPVTDVISVSESGALAGLRVYVDINHSYSSDLIMKLTSPEGTQLRLFWIGEGGEPNTNPAGWYPDDFTPKDSFEGFYGEDINGNWTITAQDMSYDEAGSLAEWRLEFTYAE